MRSQIQGGSLSSGRIGLNGRRRRNPQGTMASGLESYLDYGRG